MAIYNTAKSLKTFFQKYSGVRVLSSQLKIIHTRVYRTKLKEVHLTLFILSLLYIVAVIIYLHFLQTFYYISPVNTALFIFLKFLPTETEAAY